MKARRGEPGRFEIYNGGVFEVSQERARPLIRDAKRVFIDVTDATIAELISRIQKAAPNR